MRSRGVKTALGLVALVLPGGLLFLLGWVLVRALARVRAETGTPDGATPMGQLWQLWQVLLQEARAAL